jgi:nicotinic acid mononucleotide adenylyltransferase
MVDPWEAFQSYQRTAVVLDHFEHEINDKLGGVATLEGETRHVKILLLAGSDLIATMSEPGVWSQPDVRFPPLLSGFVITQPRFTRFSWLTSLANTGASSSSVQVLTWIKPRMA